MANDLVSREAAAQAAPFAPTVLMPTSMMAVDNIHSGLTLTSFRPGSDLRTVAGGQRLFDAVQRSEAGRPFVLGYLPDNLFERRAMMVAARRGRSVVGVLHYHVADENMVVRGLAVDPRFAGNKLGAAQVALALVHGRAVFGDIPTVECIIRQMPDGALNETSRASFAKLGFALDDEIGTSYLKGTFRDRHLFETSQADETGAVYVNHRRMAAGPEAYALARDFLAAWSRTVLPIRAAKRLGR